MKRETSAWGAAVLLAFTVCRPATADESKEQGKEAVLNEVTVSATRVERPMDEIPGTVSVISSDEMERDLMRNISDVVRYEPGVSVGNNPDRFGPNEITIRGIGGNRILMQVDGIRVPDAFSIGSFSSASRNMVDIDALKSIEILRGPGSSLYGSDAIGGVVTYTTKDPEDFMRLTDKPVFASVKAGYASADDSTFATGLFAAGRGDWQGMLVATKRNGAETENMGSVGGTGSSRTQPNPQSTDDGNLLGKLVYRFSPDNVFKFTAEHFSDKTKTDVLTLNPTTPRTTAMNGDDTDTRDRFSIEQQWRDAAGTLFQVANWKLYYQDSETSQQSGETRSNTTATCSATTAGANNCVFQRLFDFKQKITGLNAQFEKTFRSGDWGNRLVYGFDTSTTRTEETRDGVRTNVTTGAVTKNVTPDNFPVRDFPVTDTTLTGVFVEDEMQNGNFSLIPGLRYDDYRLSPKPDTMFTKDNPGITPVDMSFDALSPSLRALYRLDAHYSIYGQYAQGFRAPPYNDVNIGFTNLAFGYTSISNPDLKPEKSRGIEVGLRGNFDKANFSLAVFHNRYSDFIDSQHQLDCPGDPHCVPGLITFQSINLNNVRIEGAEFKGDVELGGGFGLAGSLAYARGDDLDTDLPIDSVDPMKLVAGLIYDAPSGDWGGQLIGTAVERKKRLDPTGAATVPSPGFGVLDLTGWWNLSKRAVLNFGVFNLGDRKYFLWSDLQGTGGGATPMASNTSIDRYSQPGRNASVSVKYQF